MQNKSRAFTLIELLVVVLIIGILAAVAVPQYQVAVTKTRYTQARIVADTIWRAQRLYHLQNGSYASSFDELDLEIPAGGSVSGKQVTYPWVHCTNAWSNVNGPNVSCDMLDGALSYIRGYADTVGGTCQVQHNLDQTKLAHQVCKSISGQTTPPDYSANFSWYSAN